MVNLTINTVPVSVKEGTTIIEAAETVGIPIPRLCYLKDINEIGACRVCVVEVEGKERLVTSCNNKVEEGMVIYTNLPGEDVQVRVTAEKKDFLRGEVVEVCSPSADRIKPVCAMYGYCPGCVYRHCTYAAENELKNQQFREFAVRAGFAEEQILPYIAPEPENGYRNKLTLHVNKAGAEVMVGYALSDGQTILQVANCPLVHPAINDLLAKQLADPGFRHTLHHRMSLTYRHTERNGVLFYRNNLPKGTSWIRENTSCGELYQWGS